MIPNWQIAGLLILVLLAAGLGIYGAPNSYAYLYLSGRCNREPMPAACHPGRLPRARVPTGFSP